MRISCTAKTVNQCACLRGIEAKETKANKCLHLLTYTLRWIYINWTALRSESVTKMGDAKVWVQSGWRGEGPEDPLSFLFNTSTEFAQKLLEESAKLGCGYIVTNGRWTPKTAAATAAVAVMEKKRVGPRLDLYPEMFCPIQHFICWRSLVCTSAHVGSHRSLSSMGSLLFLIDTSGHGTRLLSAESAVLLYWRFCLTGSWLRTSCKNTGTVGGYNSDSTISWRSVHASAETDDTSTSRRFVNLGWVEFRSAFFTSQFSNHLLPQ